MTEYKTLNLNSFSLRTLKTLFHSLLVSRSVRNLIFIWFTFFCKWAIFLLSKICKNILFMFERLKFLSGCIPIIYLSIYLIISLSICLLHSSHFGTWWDLSICDFSQLENNNLLKSFLLSSLSNVNAFQTPLNRYWTSEIIFHIS